jgi:hypothetical protein
MRVLVIAAAVAGAAILTSNAFAQETCLRPKWTECVQFPNGGRHTGTDTQNMPVQMDIPAGAEICVSLEWEIMAEEYSEFTRNGQPWPKRDWDVRTETFCLYKK